MTQLSRWSAISDCNLHQDCFSCNPAEQGYDPFNPEVVRPQEQQNGKPSGDLSGALEMVNKAIEEVRSEVEREKRKLSRIGDEPYDPSGSTSSSSSDAYKVPAAAAAATHSAYDPGSYQMTAGGYNPTPGCSKYTLDSDSPGNSSNSMEYVPTSVKKSSTRTHKQKLPSPPRSPKYSKSTSSSTCKYTVDNSKPSTDMEYDPLSNYTAGIARRSKSAQAVKVEGKRTQRLQGSDEEHVAAVKKPQQQNVDMKKYTFSDSDEESSGTEYRPTSLSNLKQRKGTSGSAGDTVGKEGRERTKGLLNALAQRNKDDLAQDADIQEQFQLKNNVEKKKMVNHEKICKFEKVNKLEKKLDKTSKHSSSSKSKESSKNSHQDSTKKENKGHERRDDRKNTTKVKTSDKVHRDDRRSDGKCRAVEKVKTDSSKREKVTENGGRESKKLKTFDKEKKQIKPKEWQHKNGQLDSSKREKDVRKLSKSSSIASSNSKGSSANSKDKVKQSISSSNGKRREEKRRSQSLSHADLFGDESAEEAGLIEVDDDDDEPEEVLVRKSADALKRGRLNKRKASELTPSSSEDEGDDGANREDKDEVASVQLDFSSFQDDLDFDSDPMEECLRIFNESKDVKKEDKGRQAKQVSSASSSSCC